MAVCGTMAGYNDKDGPGTNQTGTNKLFITNKVFDLFLVNLFTPYFDETNLFLIIQHFNYDLVISSLLKISFFLHISPNNLLF